MPRKQHRYHYIYKTTNNVNGKFYYGMHSTSNLEDGYIGSGTLLSKAVRKYGKDNFSIEILEYCETRENLRIREAELITQEILNDPMCMNIRLGGNNGSGTSGLTHSKKRKFKHLSESHKKKVSESCKGRNGKWVRKSENNEKTALANTGKKQTDETKLKRSEALKRFWKENPKAEELRKQKMELMKSNKHALKNKE